MMNSWQEWVVALLLLLCAVRIGMSIYSFFHRVKENGNPCDSCASGCELKNLYDKKRAECSGVTKKRRKLLRIVGSFKKSATFASANKK